MMSWNLMKLGVLYSRKSINAGYGRLYAVEPDKSLLLKLATAAKKLVVACGARYPESINIVWPSTIIGKLTRKSCQKKLISLSEKKVDKPIIWSAGIAPCDNDKLGMYERRFRSQRAMLIIVWLLCGSLLITT